jgi:hypothetical protein
MATKAVSNIAEKTTIVSQHRLFTLLWQRWTARAHGQAYRRALLLKALRQAQTQVDNPAWRRRLRHWQARLTGRRL